MIDADDIRALADLAGPERAFLTVYLDARDDASVLDARFGEIRSLLAGHPVETEHFEENLAIVRRLLGENAAPEHGALALYAGWAVDLAEAAALPVSVGTLARVGDAPYVRPAAELLDENETFAVAVVDNTVARIFLVTAEDAEAEARVRGDVKNRVKKGGWSQKRYARRRDKQIEGYATDVAEALVALDAERPFARLVLLGTQEAVAAVRAALRTDLADKLVGTDTVSADASDAELMDAAADVAEAGEREAEQDLWAQIREQGVGPGLAAFGATRVLEALRQARVDTVLIDREIDIAGTRCRDCERVVHGTPKTCQHCGSKDVFRVDLVETMTEMAIRTGASVDFADPFAALADAGGVAALLRYSLAENDAERQEHERRARAGQETQEQTEREPPASETLVTDEPDRPPAPLAEPVADPVEEPAEAAVVEPAAAPVVEPAALPASTPAPPDPKARQPAPKRSAAGRRASSPAPDRPTGERGLVRTALGWGLLALGLLLAVLGFRELPGEVATELLVGVGLAAFGTMSLLPKSKTSARLALGVVGFVLVAAAVVLFLFGLGQ